MTLLIHVCNFCEKKLLIFFLLEKNILFFFEVIKTHKIQQHTRNFDGLCFSGPSDCLPG